MFSTRTLHLGLQGKAQAYWMHVLHCIQQVFLHACLRAYT